MLSRRAALSLPLVPLAGWLLPRAAQAKVKSEVTEVFKGARGTTVTMQLEHAPFPAPGAGYQDATVILFIPRYFRADGGVQTVVHFHGYKNTADSAMQRHQLREQLYDSKQNAVLIVPQLALRAADTNAGKLQQRGGFARMVHDALRTAAASGKVRHATGDASLPLHPNAGKVCVSAHSAGYHAAASVLKHGELGVNETYLFDALYAETEVVREWVLARKSSSLTRRHKLVSYYTHGRTEQATRALFADFEKNHVRTALEEVEGTLSRQEIGKAQAVAIKTGLGHSGVASQYNGLRDCLFASCLQRSVRADWFESKTGARHLDERKTQ